MSLEQDCEEMQERIRLWKTMGLSAKIENDGLDKLAMLFRLASKAHRRPDWIAVGGAFYLGGWLGLLLQANGLAWALVVFVGIPNTAWVMWDCVRIYRELRKLKREALQRGKVLS